MEFMSSRVRLAISLYVALCCVVVLLPLVVVMITSFTGENFVRFPPRSLGIRWYLEVFSDAQFMQSLTYSFTIAIISTCIVAVLGIPASFAIARGNFAGKETALSIIMAPLALPHIIIAVSLLQLLGNLGIKSAPYGILAGHVLATLPFVVRLSVAGIIGIDRRIEWASKTLGASDARTFWTVTFPLAVPGISAGLLFAFLLSFDEVTISIFLSLPGQTTLPARIFEYVIEGSTPVVNAASGLLIISATLAILMIEYFFGMMKVMTARSH